MLAAQGRGGAARGGTAGPPQGRGGVQFAGFLGSDQRTDRGPGALKKFKLDRNKTQI